MKIHNYEVPARALAACESRMMTGRFRAADLTNAAMIEGVPSMLNRDFIAARVADRLIRKHSKAGNIRMTENRPWWKWVTKHER